MASATDFSIVNGQPPSCEGDERPISDAQVKAWGVERAAPRAVLMALSSQLPEQQVLRSLSIGPRGVTALVEADPSMLPSEQTRLRAALVRSTVLRERGLDVAPSGPSQLTVSADPSALTVVPLMGRAAGCREINTVLIDFAALSTAGGLDVPWRWLTREALVDDGPARSLQQRFETRLTWRQLQGFLADIERAPYQMRLAEFSVKAQGDTLEVAGTLVVPFGNSSNAVRDAGFQARMPVPNVKMPQRNPFIAAVSDPGRAGSDCERRARLWASKRQQPQFFFARGPDEKPIAMLNVGVGFLLAVQQGDEIGETGARLLRVGSRSADVDIEHAEMTATSPTTCVLKRITLQTALP